MHYVVGGAKNFCDGPDVIFFTLLFEATCAYCTVGSYGSRLKVSIAFLFADVFIATLIPLPLGCYKGCIINYHQGGATNKW